ncbi:hypothetical protein Tco_0100439 [Tanacetum coccineum]
MLDYTSSLPEDHMPDFHHYDDARDIWIAVKARFSGNEESKKMRKTMLKQQFTEFSVTEEEGLHKELASPEQTATVHAVSFDAAVLDTAALVSAACGYIVSAGIYDVAGSSVLAVFINICCILCFCCHSILLLRVDLSRNLELTESKPSLGEDCWE